MAVGTLNFPDMPLIEGIQLSALSAGIKTANKLDLVLIKLSEQARVTGVFTQNDFCAAPVILLYLPANY